MRNVDEYDRLDHDHEGHYCSHCWAALGTPHAAHCDALTTTAPRARRSRGRPLSLGDVAAQAEAEWYGTSLT